MAVQRQNVGETDEQYLHRALAYCKREFKRRRDGKRYPPHASHDASDVMRDCEKLFPDLGTFGVEGFCDDIGDYGVSYLNTGDPYNQTILFCTTPRAERWSVGCWGDIVERAPEGRYR